MSTATHERENSQSFHPARLRVLCLHDADSNATKLKTALDRLGQRLYERHSIDLVYVNSALALQPSNDETVRRVWWEETTREDSDVPQYTGLDASIMLIQQVWTSCPMQGILGVGQGAAVASIFSLLPSIEASPRFVIFCDGQTLLPETERIAPDGMETLHLISNEETESSQRLIEQFGGLVHQRPCRQSFSKDDLNVIGKFLVDQTKYNDEQAIVALQTALHCVEQEASDKIAEQIAAEPPAALMAVIRPQAVAGWSGNKRRQPGEEGGGAPCPSEFLLKRDKRKGDGGASRVHPNQQKDE